MGIPLGSLLVPPPHTLICPLPASLPRASSAWSSMTADCNTQSTSSWRAGGGAGLGTGYWTSVSLLAQSRLRHSGVLPGHHADPCLCWASQRTPVLCETPWEWAWESMLPGLLSGHSPFGGKESKWNSQTSVGVPGEASQKDFDK